MTETVQPDWLQGFTPQPNKPPKGWQPGQSGNPLGRPKGSKNRKTQLAEELHLRLGHALFKLQNHFTRDQVALMNVGTIGLQEFRDDAAGAVPSFGNRIAAGQDQRCSHPQSSKRESVGKHKKSSERCCGVQKLHQPRMITGK